MIGGQIAIWHQQQSLHHVTECLKGLLKLVLSYYLYDLYKIINNQKEAM